MRYINLLVHRDLRRTGMLYLKAGVPSNYHNLPSPAKLYIYFFDMLRMLRYVTD